MDLKCAVSTRSGFSPKKETKDALEMRNTGLTESNLKSLWPNNKMNDPEFLYIWGVVLDMFLLWMPKFTRETFQILSQRDFMWPDVGSFSQHGPKLSSSHTVLGDYIKTFFLFLFWKKIRHWDLKAVTLSFPSVAGLTTMQAAGPECTKDLGQWVSLWS